LEGKFELEINREKTRVVEITRKGGSLDFLGYTFRWDRTSKGRPDEYLNVFPSAKALAKEREKLRALTMFSSKPHADSATGTTCEPALTKLGQLAWWDLDWFVADRFKVDLGRRSQRPYRPPKGVSWHQHIQSFGLVQFHQLPRKRPMHAGGDIFWRAGCRKSALPVRRGEGRLVVILWSPPTLPVRMSFKSLL